MAVVLPALSIFRNNQGANFRAQPMRSQTHPLHSRNIEIVRRACIAAAFALAVVFPAAAADNNAKINKVVEYVKTLRTSPALVAAVAKQNSLGTNLDSVKAQHKLWLASPGIDDTMRELMESAAAKQMHGIAKSHPYILQMFLMDKQGATVAMTHKTTEYWHGERPLFQKSFNDGKGAVFVDQEKFDESTQAYLVQISVPIMNAGKAVGALTVGIDIGKL
jgi:hypothetical protein